MEEETIRLAIVRSMLISLTLYFISIFKMTNRIVKEVQWKFLGDAKMIGGRSIMVVGI